MGIDTVVGVGEDRDDYVGGKGSSYAELKIGASARDTPDCDERADRVRKKEWNTVWKEVPSIEHPGKYLIVSEVFDLLGLG